MFAIFVLLFAANFLAAENFVIPEIVEEGSISIQTSTTENIVENASGMGSSMQSTVENVEMSITDIDSPIENMVEEIVEESELDIMENITGMGSGIETISENVESLSENIGGVVSSPLQNLESSLMTENIVSEMGSLPIMPTTMADEIIGESSGTIRGLESMMPSGPYSMNSLSSMQNLPSTNTLSAMEELEMMSDMESMMPYPPGMSPLSGNYNSPLMESIPGMGNLPSNIPYLSDKGPLSSITSQIGGNYNSPLETIPGMKNLPPNMPYPSSTGPLSSITSQMGNYNSALTDTIPGMKNLPPNMPYPSNTGPLSSITSQISGNYNSPLMETIPGMGNLSQNMPLPSMTGLTSPLTSSIQQLESQIGQPSSSMPYLESPLTPRPPGMPLMPTSSMQGLESELEFMSPGPMLSNMLSSYRPNKGLLSPLTSTIKEMENEIEESSIPLMNMINKSPFAPPTMGPVLALPSLGTTLDELEEVATSSIPLMGKTPGSSLPMRPSASKMPTMQGLIDVPSIGSAMSQLEQGINGSPLPLMQNIPVIGNSLPFLQKPTGGYSNLPNKENIQPLGALSPSTGYAPSSGLPLIGNIMSPFQNLPLMNRFVSPLMGNMSNMQQPLMSNVSNMQQPFGPGNQPLPNGGLLSPLRQAMTNLKNIPSLLQQPSNMLNMGPNSMMSNVGLSELTSLINQDSQLPISQKNQFLSQMSNLGPSSLGMIQNMYSMLGNSWQSRLRRQMEKVRQARRQLFDAIECFMSGDEQGMRQHIMAAIAALGNSPMTTALQYALNQDSSSLSLMANMSRLILDKIQ